MKYQIYAVYDMATEYFMSPFFVKTEKEAIRGFSDAALDDNTPIGKHPGDYHLYRLGEYTDHNGDLRKQTPEVIISAIEVATPSRQKE